MLTGALTALDEEPIEYDSDEDPYQEALYAYEMVVQMARYWGTCSMGMADSCGMAFINAHIQHQL